MGYNFLQGKYKCMNPKKYTGKLDNIVYRSSWELAAFKWCDTQPNVVRWNSEEEVIPYRSPLDGRTHRYFMDLKIWFKRPDGGISIILVEIKPEDQTKPPRKGNKKEENFLKEVATWKVNDAKWKATEAFCKEKGWHFQIWTEKQLLAGVENDAAIKQRMRQRTRERKKQLNENSQRKRKVAKLAAGLKEELKKRTGA